MAAMYTPPNGALLLGKPLTSSGGCAVKRMTASMSKLYCAGDGGKGLVPSTRSASCDALIGFWPVGEDMLTLPLLQLESQPANCPPAGLLRGVPLRLLGCANGGKHAQSTCHFSHLSRTRLALLSA